MCAQKYFYPAENAYYPAISTLPSPYRARIVEALLFYIQGFPYAHLLRHQQSLPL